MENLAVNLVGNIASIAIANGKIKLKPSDLTIFLSVLNLDFHADALIKKAFEYFNEMGVPSIRDDIKNTYINEYGASLIQ